MSRKSWYLDRRTLLHGAGVSLALPWLECMTLAGSVDPSPAPRRFCAMYFPFGVSLPSEDSENAHWRWFPHGEGPDFQFNQSLEVLEPHRAKLTVLGGLSHPNGRKMGGHDTGDTFLTAALMNSRSLQNTISVDQRMADQLGDQTRFRSLVLSTDGGVGEPTRASTLSYNDKGRPVPALNQPQQIFDRFFGAGDANTVESQRRTRHTSSMLDRVLEDTRSLRRRLGSSDQRKLDEYISSVQQIEQQVERSQRWMEIPKPELSDDDRQMLQLDANDAVPKFFIRTMYDLIYLAFRTDSTRIATYQIASMADQSSKAGKFPQLEGFQGSLHKLAHGWNKPEGARELGQWDRFMAEQLAYFLDRLDSVDEGDGTLLDHSLVLYGSSNSNTHNNQNYPLILAGGRSMNCRHGHYRRFSDEIPLSNLFVTLLNRMGLDEDSFADSTGEISDLIG